MIRRLVTAFALGMVFAGSSFLGASAAEPTKDEKIKTLFQLIQMDKMIEQLNAQQVEQAKKIVTAMIPKNSVIAADQPAIEKYLARVIQITKGEVSWKKLEPDYIDLYARTYSDAEVDGLLQFYGSAVGQAVVAKKPALLTNSQMLTQKRLDAMQPRLREALSELTEELQAAYPAQKK